MSPYKALYGREPPSLIAASPSARTPPTTADLIRQRGTLLVELRRNLEQAQQRMRDSANRHRRHVEFAVGDMVWLKLQPYCQYLVARPLSAKLARRYYGPFEVIQRVGPVAYRLRLPQGSRIHNVFHVSLLREFVPENAANTPSILPEEFIGERPVVRPVEVVEKRTLWHKGRPVEHALVRWADGDESTSWEPMEMLKAKFPSLLLEDKEIVNGEGVDTTTSSIPTGDAQEPEHEEQRRDEDEVTTQEDKRREPEKEPAVKSSRPKRQTRPPDRFNGYVSR